MLKKFKNNKKNGPKCNVIKKPLDNAQNQPEK